MEIVKVKQRNDGLKWLVVPKKCNISEGDHVVIVKLSEEKLRSKALSKLTRIKGGVANSH